MFGTRIVLLVAGLLGSVVIARALGPDGRGQYAVIVSVVSIAVAIGHCSLEQSQVYFASLGENVRSMAANALALGLVLSIPIATVTFGATRILNVHSSGTTTWQLVVALLAVPASLIVLWSNGLLVLDGRVKALNKGMLFAGLGQVAALLAIAASGRMSVGWVIVIWTANALAPLLIVLPALKPRWRDLDLSLARSELLHGLRYHPAQLSLYLVLRVDVLLLAAMTNSSTVGLYALAVTVTELTNVATDAVSTAILHRQTHLSMTESARFTARAVAISGALATATIAGLLIVSPLAVPMVFGHDFKGSVPVIASLAPGVAALAMVRSAGGFLLRRNRPLINGSLAALALLLNLLLNVWLVPLWGAVGCGIASSLAYLGLAGCYLVWLVRAGRLGVRDFWPGMAAARRS